MACAIPSEPEKVLNGQLVYSGWRHARQMATGVIISSLEEFTIESVN